MAQAKNLRNDGRIDSRPRRNVECGYVVGGASEPAPRTREVISRRSILFSLVPALRADMRGSPWIHSDDGDSCESRFVLDEGSQLSEAPRTMASTLCPSYRYPGADARQIFEGYSAPGVFGFRNQLLGYAMIDIPSEPLFPPGEFLQMPLCALGPNGLKLGPEMCGPVPALIDGLPAMSFTITIDGNIDDAEVYAKGSGRPDFLRLWNINDNAEIEYIINQNQVCLASDPVEPGFMICRHHDGNEGSTLKGQDGHAVEALPTQDTLVIDHGSVRSKLRLDAPVPLISLADLGNGPDGHLGREPEGVSNLTIDDLLELHLVSGLFPARSLCDMITGDIEPLHRGLERLELLRARPELDLERQVHDIEHTLQSLYTLWYSPIPPTAKARGPPWRHGA